MSENLLPCPFCGGEAEYCNEEICGINNQRHWTHFVYCRKCRAGIKKYATEHTAKHVTELWNHRSEPQARVLTVEELQDRINTPVWCEMQTDYYKCGVVGKKKMADGNYRLVVGFTYGFEWIEDVIGRTGGKIYDRQPAEGVRG